MGKIIGEGITFDDVLLVPAYSEVIPNQVDLTTYLTKTIKLNIPHFQILTLILAQRIMECQQLRGISSVFFSVHP